MQKPCQVFDRNSLRISKLKYALPLCIYLKSKIARKNTLFAKQCLDEGDFILFCHSVWTALTGAKMLFTSLLLQVRRPVPSPVAQF